MYIYIYIHTHIYAYIHIHAVQVLTPERCLWQYDHQFLSLVVFVLVGIGADGDNFQEVSTCGALEVRLDKCPLGW